MSWPTEQIFQPKLKENDFKYEIYGFQFSSKFLYFQCWQKFNNYASVLRETKPNTSTQWVRTGTWQAGSKQHLGLENNLVPQVVILLHSAPLSFLMAKHIFPKSPSLVRHADLYWHQEHGCSDILICYPRLPKIKQPPAPPQTAVTGPTTIMVTQLVVTYTQSTHDTSNNNKKIWTASENWGYKWWFLQTLKTHFSPKMGYFLKNINYPQPRSMMFSIRDKRSLLIHCFVTLLFW